MNISLYSLLCSAFCLTNNAGVAGVDVAPSGGKTTYYVAAVFAALFAVLCAVVVALCIVQLVRYKRNG